MSHGPKETLDGEKSINLRRGCNHHPRRFVRNKAPLVERIYTLQHKAK